MEEKSGLGISIPTASTGAKRDSIGNKVSTTLVPYEAIMAMAVGLNYGEKKYGAHNYLKGLPMDDLLNSIERHTRALMAGDLADLESGLPHWCLLASSVAMLVATIERDLSPEKVPPQPQLVGYHYTDIDRRMMEVQKRAIGALELRVAADHAKDPKYGTITTADPTCPGDANGY